MRPAAVALLLLAGCARPERREATPAQMADAAIADLDKQLLAKPDWVEGHISRANALDALGFEEEAIAGYDRALALEPKRLDALIPRGILLANRGRRADAERDFKAVIDLAPKAPDGYLLRAWLERQDGRYSESERDLAEARTLGPTRWEDYHHAGVAAAKADRWKQAKLNFVLAVMLRPDHADGWLALSRLGAAHGQNEQALEDLDRAEQARPNDASIWYARAEILRSLERHSEAIRAYDAAIKFGPRAIMYAGRGLSREASNDAKGAEADYGLAVRQEPNCREAWVARARLRSAAGRLEEARSDYAEALRLRASATVMHELARLHHNREEWTVAKAGYETALRLCEEPELRVRIERDLTDARAFRK